MNGPAFWAAHLEHASKSPYTQAPGYVVTRVEIDCGDPRRPSLNVAAREGRVSEFWLQLNGELTLQTVERYREILFAETMRRGGSRRLVLSPGALRRIVESAPSQEGR